MSSKYYITTTLPYINSDPHVGFAAEIIKADVIARWQRLMGKEVIFNTGTDEHGLKIYRKAQKQNMDLMEYCDKSAQKFIELKEHLNLSYDRFIRTTDEHHVKAAQEFWQRCEKNGDIYKKNYKVKYCVGCELEKTESELVDDRCPWHPKQELDYINEENYFFKFSKYQEDLLNLYENNPDFVKPKHRLQEIKSFVKRGINDFSISRLKEKMPWGVPVPGDDSQVMYVWFDALVNYISTLAWPNEEGDFKNFWPGVQVAGKDNLRQQSAMWQAMLMSAGIANSEKVLVFGFLTSEGEKISKSLGNNINPIEYSKKYGEDALRYYLLEQIPTYGDGDFSVSNFESLYNSHLANELGNLASRLSNLIAKEEFNPNIKRDSDQEFNKKVEDLMSKYELQFALHAIWEKIRETNEYLSKEAPWKIEDKEKKQKVLELSLQSFYDACLKLQVFLPRTCEKILKHFETRPIEKIDPLFPKIKNN
ncbi:MAG: methionine--tRNA ligase [Parcubacteria group bacterium]